MTARSQRPTINPQSTHPHYQHVDALTSQPHLGREVRKIRPGPGPGGLAIRAKITHVRRVWGHRRLAALLEFQNSELRTL